MPFTDPELQKKSQERYYKENRDRLLSSQTLKRNSYVRKTQEIKSSTPCADCKTVFPHYVMDFDHVHGKKRFNISSTSKIPSLKVLEEELLKCEVVCANCHRHRTFVRACK